MPLLTGKDFIDDEAVKRNDPDTPIEPEYGAEYDDEDRLKDDPKKDDPTAKVGGLPDDNGTTKPNTETPKRARSESADIDAVKTSAVKLEMTEQQFAKARNLVANAAKQGMSFSQDTGCSFTDKTMVYKTATADLVLTHPDGSKTNTIGCFGVWVSDLAKGTQIPYISCSKYTRVPQSLLNGRSHGHTTGANWCGNHKLRRFEGETSLIFQNRQLPRPRSK